MEEIYEERTHLHLRYVISSHHTNEKHDDCSKVAHCMKLQIKILINSQLEMSMSH